MSNWIEKNNTLTKSYQFDDFVQAWGFLTSVALLAEQQRHHPTIHNTYNRVDITLTTHDAGNTVTDKDQKLAKAIDKI